MKVTYEIHRHYTHDQALGDPYRTVTASSDTPQGREVIRALDHAGKLYKDACYIGCKIISIEDDAPASDAGQDDPTTHHDKTPCPKPLTDIELGNFPLHIPG